MNQKLQQILTCLSKAGLVHETILKPEDILVHEANRAGAMVNGYDAIAKGQHIEQTGLKSQLLPLGSACVEMNPKKRSNQLAANVAMCEKASGMLGSINGQEKFLSLGTSHFAMYCRALQQHVTRPDGSKLQPLPEFLPLLQEGWKWTILSYQIEDEFPTFTSWCQATLNSVNSAGQHLVLFWTLSMFLQDGSAHKFTFSDKQDSGSRICMMRKSIFSAKAMRGDDGEEAEQASLSKYTQLQHLDLTKDTEILESWQRMKERHNTVSKGDWKNGYKCLALTTVHTPCFCQAHSIAKTWCSQCPSIAMITCTVCAAKESCALSAFGLWMHFAMQGCMTYGTLCIHSCSYGCHLAPSSQSSHMTYSTQSRWKHTSPASTSNPQPARC